MLTNPYGTPYQETVKVKENRGGLIGKYIDLLIGEKTRYKTVTKWTDGITAHTEKLIHIIKEQQNKIQQEKAEKIRKQNNTRGRL